MHALSEEMAKVEKALDNPEMVCDYEFARTDAVNIEGEMNELTEAIEILNKHVK